MKKSILAIIGSASKGSSNLKLVNKIAGLAAAEFDFKIFDRLTDLPHFDPELSDGRAPGPVVKIRQEISTADGIIICTPEYVFSIPSGLKNLIEWCVSTTVFSEKPAGLITASAHGARSHEDLGLIMRTVGAKFTNDTCLLVQGIKGKMDESGNVTDAGLLENLNTFYEGFRNLVNERSINNF